jgi:hypothetical protein
VCRGPGWRPAVPAANHMPGAGSAKTLVTLLAKAAARVMTGAAVVPGLIQRTDTRIGRGCRRALSQLRSEYEAESTEPAAGDRK